MNPIIRDIYSAKVEFDFREDQSCDARLHYNGHRYLGVAYLHPDDTDFYSKIVGTNIALSRARQNALACSLRDSEIALKAKKEMYWQATAGISGPVDPTGRFYKALTREEENVKELRQVLREEKHALKIYLLNQNEAITLVKGYRAEKAEDN